jgi:hypothetical protein
MKQVFVSIFFAIAATFVVVGGAFAQGSGGVSGPAFYVEGTLYRTVATPTDLSNTGAPDSSFDTIYNFGGTQRNVATSAPGLPGYNGGRWQVHALAFPNGYAAALAAHDANGSGAFDTTAEVHAALADGSVVDTGIVRMFVCTVIKLPNNG